jgi:hypothetical protein
MLIYLCCKNFSRETIECSKCIFDKRLDKTLEQTLPVVVELQRRNAIFHLPRWGSLPLPSPFYSPADKEYIFERILYSQCRHQ